MSESSRFNAHEVALILKNVQEASDVLDLAESTHQEVVDEYEEAFNKVFVEKDRSPENMDALDRCKAAKLKSAAEVDQAKKVFEKADAMVQKLENS